MHPALSVILFTTFSGAGFGLLVFLGLGLPAPTGLVAFLWYTLAYALAAGGLLASAFHLGHPERALRAFKAAVVKYFRQRIVPHDDLGVGRHVFQVGHSFVVRDDLDECRIPQRKPLAIAAASRRATVRRYLRQCQVTVSCIVGALYSWRPR